tara:strand:- start:5330 stop:5761 length:432 start_codon:yes stop_codon:yes gene_type:complete
MANIQRYTANNLSELMDKIAKNSIGLDSYIDQFWQTTPTNYPPYNIIQHNNHESSLEIALAGFKKKEVKVYTEHGKLYVEGKKEEKKGEDCNCVHRGIAQRSFERSWQLSDDVEITKVTFEDGLLTVDLGKVVPEHHARKDFL